MYHKLFVATITALLMVMFSEETSAASTPLVKNDNPYLGMSIEELMQVQVSVASKKAQSIEDTAAAVYVITAEDIHRSVATTIPELLRGVPGFEASRIDSHTWATSARGLASGFSADLLVMIDGRSVFTPLFGGVYWDVQNIMLKDVDRIEIVRGSGGAIWGANAVAGVINIITKSSFDTEGGLVVAGGVSDKKEKGFVATRYGFSLGEHGAGRIYAKGFKRDDANARANAAVPDWKEQRVGFRGDWDLAGDSTFMLDTAAYKGSESSVSSIMSASAPYKTLTTYQTDTSGAHMLGLWKKSGLSVQAYFDRTERSRLVFGEKRDTTDIEVKYHQTSIDNHDIQYGMGYRLTSDDMTNTYTINFNPASKTDPLYSAFIQDEITITPDVLVTLGLKVEHNNYSGAENAPNIRALWKMTENQRLWASVSRSFIPPTRADHDMSQVFVSSAFFNLNQVPSPNVKTTDVRSYELGYRYIAGHDFTLEFASYFNDYTNYVTNEELPYDPVTSSVGIESANYLDGFIKGFELNTVWQTLDELRLTMSYAWSKAMSSSTGGNDTGSQGIFETRKMNHAWVFGSKWDVTDHVIWDTSYYVNTESIATGIPGYTRLDTRLGWQPTEDLALSLAVQNLQDKKHAEFPTFSNELNEFGRSYYADVTFGF